MTQGMRGYDYDTKYIIQFMARQERIKSYEERYIMQVQKLTFFLGLFCSSNIDHPLVNSHPLQNLCRILLPVETVTCGDGLNFVMYPRQILKQLGLQG
jgi:hypothetical protein